jgi:hypothetical protein
VALDAPAAELVDDDAVQLGAEGGDVGGLVGRPDEAATTRPAVSSDWKLPLTSRMSRRRAGRSSGMSSDSTSAPKGM